MRRALIAIAVAVVAASSSVAFAQRPPAGDKTDAKALMQLGVKLLGSNDYLGALAVFRDAYARFPSPKILVNIGTTLHAMKRDAEAANTYQLFLDASDTEPALRTEVAKSLADLDPSLGRLVVTAPANAELRVFEDWVPAKDTTVLRVAPGKYTLHARLDGFQPYEQAGTVAAGQQVAVTVTLDPVPKPQPMVVRVAEPVATVTPPEPRSRLGAVALGHFDLSGGAAALVGGTFDATERFAVEATAILGPNSGAYVGAQLAILTGTVRPLVAAGVPVFFNSGARFALRGAVGLEIAANRHLSLIVELGVEHNLNPQSSVVISGMPRSIDATSFIPAVGAVARL
jgi:hypothetical protein